MIQIYDTTLRDGTQRTDISLSVSDKLNIARRLDDLGVAFIEGGWPGSNPKDAEFFRRAVTSWKTAQIAAFGSTCAANKHPEDDENTRPVRCLHADLYRGGKTLHCTSWMCCAPARENQPAHH
jgi:2-isopropylmalate synthase